MFWKTLNGRNPWVANTKYRYPVGRWTKHLDPGDLFECGWGYHLARDGQVLEWLAPHLYAAEPCEEHGIVIEGADKVVTCRVRLTKAEGWDMVRFAQDCADHVAHLDNEFAGAAAGAAAWAAAREAARAAREAAGAAGAAAREAARAAARAAERDWQYRHLLGMIGIEA